MSKDLKELAVDIKGKKYVLVSDRVLYFNETYPDGSITTQLISAPEAETVIIKASVYPNMPRHLQGAPANLVSERVFTAYSQATWGDGMVNKTAALENAETSAVGRALAFMGIGVIESIASADEVKKAVTQPAWTPRATAAAKPGDLPPLTPGAKPQTVAPPWRPKHQDAAMESAQFDAGERTINLDDE